MSHTVTIREDARAMRQGKGQHTVSAAEYATLVGEWNRIHSERHTNPRTVTRLRSPNNA